MPKQRSWTDEQLTTAVKKSFSYRMVLIKLNLIPAGGNYEQIKNRIKDLGLNVEHFTGSRWNVGERRKQTNFGIPTEKVLVKNSTYQSHKLKNRLFREKIKEAICEMCGWCEVSVDGRVPVELDHINGDRHDNRIENLRILCPNCHSLQSTHRGKNKRFSALTK